MKRLPDFLTSGKRAKTVQPFFTDRKQTAQLLRSLDHDARKIAPYLMKRLPLGGSKTLLDVGGGLGSFTFACCRQFHHLRAAIVEHPRVVAPLTRHEVRKAKIAHRVQVVALDIAKDPLPRGFDLVLISNVLHGQGERENRALLRSGYRCLNHGGRIVVRDVFVKRARTSPTGARCFPLRCFCTHPTAAVTRWMKCAPGSARRDSRASQAHSAPARYRVDCGKMIPAYAFVGSPFVGFINLKGVVS